MCHASGLLRSVRSFHAEDDVGDGVEGQSLQIGKDGVLNSVTVTSQSTLLGLLMKY